MAMNGEEDNLIMVNPIMRVFMNKNILNIARIEFKEEDFFYFISYSV